MAEAARRPWSRWRASDTNYGADDGHPLADGTATIVRTPLGSGGGVQVRLVADGQRLRQAPTLWRWKARSINGTVGWPGRIRVPGGLAG